MMNTLSTGWWLQAISKTLVNCHHQVEWYWQNPGKKNRDDFPFYVCSYRQPTLRHKYMPGGCEYACKFPSGWETHLKIEHENPRWTLNTNPQKPIKTHLKHLWCGSETLSSSLAPRCIGNMENPWKPHCSPHPSLLSPPRSTHGFWQLGPLSAQSSILNSLQDGVPKIAKLPYKWLNYGLW